MRAPSLAETDLLVPLHDGVFEQPMWQTFLARLRAAAGVAIAGLVLSPPDDAEAIILSAASPALSAATGKGAQALSNNPLLSRRMREARIYALDELIALGREPAAEFSRSALAPRGLGFMRSMRIAETSGLEAWLWLANDEEPGAGASALLAALAPHLRVALKVFASLERERARSDVSATVFRRMNFGWISIDRACRIVDLDEQAERVLRQSGLLRRGPYDRLMPASAAIDRDLSALARTFATDPDAKPRAIPLSRDPWIDMLVAPLRVRAMTSGAQPVAAVYLSGDRSSRSDRCEQLAELFQLSASEARLAWSMAQGLSIAEAAAEHGLTIETARNYSKKIYAKTGARGQSDLVRHILTSVLALAP